MKGGKKKETKIKSVSRQESLRAVMVFCHAYTFWLRSLSERIRVLLKYCLFISGSLMIRVLAVWQAMASVSSDSLPSLVPALSMRSSSGKALRA